MKLFAFHTTIAAVIHFLTRPVHIVSAATIVVLCSHPLAAEDAITDLSDDMLIERLASQNPRPVDLARVGPPTVSSFPREYSSEHQRIVREALDEVVRRGHRVFPALTKHLSDDRYSCIWGSSSDPFPCNVGNLCYFVLHSSVRPWPSTIKNSGNEPVGFTNGCYTVPLRRDAPKWFEARRNTALSGLQFEAITASIEFVKGTDELSNTDGLRTEYVDGLKWCREYITLTGKPLGIRLAWDIWDGASERLPKGEPVLSPDVCPVFEHVPDVIKRIGEPPFRGAAVTADVSCVDSLD